MNIQTTIQELIFMRARNDKFQEKELGLLLRNRTRFPFLEIWLTSITLKNRFLNLFQDNSLSLIVVFIFLIPCINCFATLENKQLEQSISYGPKKEAFPKNIIQPQIHQVPNWTLFADVLLMNSNINTTFSDEQILFDSDVFYVTSHIVNRDYKQIDPNYNLGLSCGLEYLFYKRNIKISANYKYIQNNGNGSLNKQTESLVNSKSIQFNKINDYGHQHVHLHIADLIIESSFTINPYVLISFGSGLTYNNWHYFFTLKNNDFVSNRDITDGSLISEYKAYLSSSRKTNINGLGPKLNNVFHFELFNNQRNYQLNFTGEFQLAFLFSKILSKGNYDSTSEIEGFLDNKNTLKTTWKNSYAIKVIPNFNVDGALESIFYGKKWNTKIAFGYKFWAYWKIDEFNRSVIYSGGRESIGLSEERITSFFGPYLSSSWSF